jgi:hemerythrin-like metal-binding protein
MPRTTTVTFRWQPEYTVFDDELDRHHQQLIRYIQVLDDPANRGRADSDFLKMVVDGLVAYAVFHFDAEEARMAAAGYPGLEGHRREHLDFARDAALFKDTFGRGSPRFERIVLSYLKDWLQGHILTSDKQMGLWLKEHLPTAP